MRSTMRNSKLRFRHSPVWRAKRRGLLRNAEALVLLGNRRCREAVPVLYAGLHGCGTTGAVERVPGHWGKWEAKFATGDLLAAAAGR